MKIIIIKFCAWIMALTVSLSSCTPQPRALTIQEAMDVDSGEIIRLNACLFSSRAVSTLRDCNNRSPDMFFRFDQKISEGEQSRFMEMAYSAWSPSPNQVYAAHVILLGSVQESSPEENRVFTIIKIISTDKKSLSD